MAMGGGSLILIVVALLFGRGDIAQLIGQSASQGQSVQTSEVPVQVSPESQKHFEFVSFLMDHQQSTWAKIFAKEGARYQSAKLVVFSENVRSACGVQSSGVGPFYCPGDQQAYIDLSFFRELANLGGPGDFAQAYVLAHELGHHLQTITGISAKVHKLKQRDRRNANEYSIRQELQADCYAGVWGYWAGQDGLLEMGDVEEGLRAAAAIGDDALQRRSTGTVRPEAWTHGSSEQRMEWFMRGQKSGDMHACDTFQ